MVIDWIEISWLAIFVFGVVGSAWNVRDAWLDLRAVTRAGRLRAVALWGFRAEGVRFLSMACFALSGVGALLNWHRMVIIGLLIAGGIVMSTNTWLDRYDRHRLLRGRR